MIHARELCWNQFILILPFYLSPSILHPLLESLKNEFGFILLRHTGNTVQIITSATMGSSYSS